jgi:glycosyltransferase involved in cell wall biosynthesis
LQREVLILAPTSFFADYGCHVRILNEVTALQRLGHRVVVCTYHNGEDVEGVHTVRTPGIPWRRSYEVGSSLHKVAFDALLSVRSLAWTLRHKPHVIHAHLHEGALIGYVLSRLWRVPLIFDFQGSLTGEMMDHGFLSPDSPLRRPLRRLEELIDHLPRTIIVSSNHAARLLHEEFSCQQAEIHILPDAVDTDLFRPDGAEQEIAALKQRLGIPLNCRVVVYLGLLAEYQGTGLLLKAAEELAGRYPDLHFLIMGHPNVDHYRELAARMGLSGRVTFAGRIHYAEAHHYLRLGDVAVGPKISVTEGSGKLPNYMAMGLATVAFDTPVSREYLGEWGVYAQIGDAASLASGIASMLEDRELATTLGTKLRERAVQRYSLPVLREQLRSIYSAALTPQ